MNSNTSVSGVYNTTSRNPCTATGSPWHPDVGDLDVQSVVYVVGVDESYRDFQFICTDWKKKSSRLSRFGTHPSRRIRQFLSHLDEFDGLPEFTTLFMIILDRLNAGKSTDSSSPCGHQNQIDFIVDWVSSSNIRPYGSWESWSNSKRSIPFDPPSRSRAVGMPWFSIVLFLQTARCTAVILSASVLCNRESHSEYQSKLVQFAG